MTKKIFYEKVGRKYVPVKEYDDDLVSALPKGNHLIMCYPGGRSTRYNVDPDYAALIAAGRVARDVMAQALVKASEMRPKKKPLTSEQKEAWDNLKKAFGDDMYTLHVDSAHDIAQAGIDALQKTARELYSKNSSVQAALDHLYLLTKLTKD
jgi:hypothetical protein